MDAEAIKTRVDAVLGDPLYWFPVRHHSPTVARHLAAVIRARRPKVIFIEGPFEATGLIQHIVDADTVPPVAIYTSYRDDDNALGLNGIASPAPDIPARFAAWYPLTAYSPEFIAMRLAAQIGASVQFIDLPHHATIRTADAAKIPTAQDDDRLISASGFYRELAAAAGFKTWDEAWDSLFENPLATDAETFRRELVTFCCAARLTTATQGRPRLVYRLRGGS